MTPTEHTSKKPSLTTGLFATLSGSRHLQGSGAGGRALIIVLTTLLVTLATLTLTPGASAATTRNLLRTFGCAGPVSEACAVPAPAGSTLKEPQGEAVVASGSEAGDVYVADTANNRVEKFNEKGEFLLMFGSGVNKDPLSPDVCKLLEAELGECQPGKEGSGPGEFKHAQFVAIDQTTGDVYVADTGDNIVSKFSSAGVLEKATWGTNGQLTGKSPTEPFGEIAGITVDGEGTLYVLNTSGFVFAFAPRSSFSKEVQLLVGASMNGFGLDAQGDLVSSFGGARIIVSEPSGGFIGVLTSGVEAGPISSGPEGGVYFAGLNDSVGHYAFNVAGEVLEAGGGTCRFAEVGGCEPSDLVAVGFVGAGVAASSGEDVFLSNAAAGTVYEYSAPLVIPDVTTEPATKVKPRGVTFNGKVSPDGLPVTECVFEYGETASYGHSAGCEQSLEAISKGKDGKGDEPVAVDAEIKGLMPGVVYHFRLIARNANDPGPRAVPDPGADEHFETLPPPAIDEATVTNLTREAATLNAKIKPGLSGTEPHYHFEYEPEVSYLSNREKGLESFAGAASTPEVGISAGTSDVFESAPIGELKENVTYYWRVVATNESGTTTGVQHTFRYDTSGEGLPDGRAYELVSPAHKNGAFLHGRFEIAPDGERVMTVALQCFGGAGSCTADRGGILGDAPYAFTRTSGGWVSEALATSAAQFDGADVWGMDALTGDVLLSMPTPAALGGNGEDDFYVREAGGLAHLGPVTPPVDGAHSPESGIAGDKKQAASADYSHFVWEAPKTVAFEADTGVFTVYEYVRPEGGLLGSGSTQPLLVGVSGGEGAKSLISACETLLGGTNRSNLEMYPGRLSEGGRSVFFTAIGPCEGTGENVGREVSVDEVFARVDGELRPGEAHALGVAGAHTVAVSEPSTQEVEGREELVPAAPYPGCEGALCVKNVNEKANFANAEFVGASKDGSKAFFLSPQQLTDEASEDPNKNAATGAPLKAPQLCHVSGAEVGGCNLYVFDLAAPEGHGLVDVSRGDSSGEGPRVQGVVALAPDGSHVYFVAKGILTSSPNGRGLLAHNGAENLYLYEQDASYPHGRTVFIADLLPGQAGVGDEPEWKGQPGEPANVSPDGRFLVFLSRGDLTADDTSVSGASQVFRYDAVTGVLKRVSIGNDGFDDDGNRSSRDVCTIGCEEDAGIVPVTVTEAERPDPSMSDDGSRVFFMSPVGLTPHALDDVPAGEVTNEVVLAQNVYEWESEGVGSCPAGRSAGCVFLISDGRDVFKNETNYGLGGQACSKWVAICLLGTDGEGKNVLFATADSLVKGDTNSEIDYYDARICEPENGNPCVTEPPPPLPPCAGETCHGIPAEQLASPGGGTLTLKGQGNVKPSVVAPPSVQTRAQKLANALKRCRKDRKKAKRIACEKQAKKKYRATKAKKSVKANRRSK